MSAFEKERETAAAALKANDEAAAQKLSENARRSLLEARRLYQSTRVVRDGRTEWRARYIEVLRLLGDYDLAAEMLRKQLRDLPDFAEWWFELGDCLIRCGPTFRHECFDALRKALALKPGGDLAAQVNARLGDFYYEEGLFDFAKTYYGKALELKKDDVRTRIALDALKVRDGALVDSAKDLDELGRAAQPFDAFMRERLRAALADFDAQHRLFPDTIENHRAYARTLYRAARLPEAIMAARRATQLDPKDPATLNFLAAMQSQLGNLEAAKAAYEASLQSDPNQPGLADAIKAIGEQLTKKPPSNPPTAAAKP